MCKLKFSIVLVHEVIDEFIYHACSKKLDYSGGSLGTINIQHKNYTTYKLFTLMANMNIGSKVSMRICK